MLGEAMICYSRASRRIAELEREREIFALAGEDRLHPFVYAKRLAEIDREIEFCQAEIDSWGAAIEEVAAGEAEEMEQGYDEPDSFAETFEWLCRVDGVEPDIADELDDVKTIEQLMLEDLRVRALEI